MKKQLDEISKSSRVHCKNPTENQAYLASPDWEEALRFRAFVRGAFRILALAPSLGLGL